MNVPPWAGFVADFPDDQVETLQDIEVYGGRNVALALGEIFVRLGCSRVSHPDPAGEQGWEFDFYYEDRHRFWCRVQSFHPVFWLLFDDVSGTKKGAFAYAELWRKFGKALEDDPRFRKILWRPFKEGPPDWDEVEAAVDPLDRTFDETFPPSEIRPKRKLRFGGWPFVIWVWFTLSGAGSLAVGFTLPAGRARSEDIGIGTFMLVACATLPISILVESIRRRVLGGTSKEGPPDWDEFTLTDDLPPRNILDALPPRPSKPRVTAAGGPLARVIIGAWFVLVVAVFALIETSIHSHKEQGEFKSLAVAGLLVGLAIVLVVIDWLRKRHSLGEPPDSGA